MTKLMPAISIAIILAFAFVLFAVPALVSAKKGCTVTVTAGDGATAIQDAIDDASTGDKICLKGTFTTTSGPSGTSEVATVTIGKSDITLRSASTAILDGGSGPAFRLADDVYNVTIKGLEIKNRTGSRGGGIEAWNRTTSHITIRNNNIHDNTYNAVLVGSEGLDIHSHWKVENNKVKDNGFAGVELTNCEKCTIKGNDIDGNFYGIVVQARNSISGSGPTTIGGVHVVNNTIDGAAAYGIYVLSFTGHPTNFTPITGASTLLKNVAVGGNTVTDTTGWCWPSGSLPPCSAGETFIDGRGIRFWAYNNAATATHGQIVNNEVNCLSGNPGIQILERGASGQEGDVEKIKVKGNTIDSDCSPPITDEQQ